MFAWASIGKTVVGAALMGIFLTTAVQVQRQAQSRQALLGMADYSQGTRTRCTDADFSMCGDNYPYNDCNDTFCHYCGDGACADPENLNTCPQDCGGSCLIEDQDGDGICEENDVCPGGDDTIDPDGDSIPTYCDSCPDDYMNDEDGDGVCGDSDPCPFDNPDDGDGDGQCDSADNCPDDDGDDVCNADDVCPGHDDNEDTNGNGVPNGCEPECGDGEKQPDEECDGQNHCTNSCSCESGYHPDSLTFPVVQHFCLPQCGDGYLRDAEKCDDGDTTPGDGCDATCWVENGWSCSNPDGNDSPSVCRARCGDGIYDFGFEVCDPGISGDCNASCTQCVGMGYKPDGKGSCTLLCGNGVVDGAIEQCDINDPKTSEGCNEGCQCAEGYVLAGGKCVINHCGNGFLETERGEQCDTPNEGHCNATCGCEAGYEPNPAGNVFSCTPKCGNGKLDVFEQCDGGFGCEVCKCLPKYEQDPDNEVACRPLCGNKKVDPGEQCDSDDRCEDGDSCKCKTGFVYSSIHGCISTCEWVPQPDCNGFWTPGKGKSVCCASLGAWQCEGGTTTCPDNCEDLGKTCDTETFDPATQTCANVDPPVCVEIKDKTCAEMNTTCTTATFNPATQTCIDVDAPICTKIEDKTCAAMNRTCETATYNHDTQKCIPQDAPTCFKIEPLTCQEKAQKYCDANPSCGEGGKTCTVLGTPGADGKCYECKGPRKCPQAEPSLWDNIRCSVNGGTKCCMATGQWSCHSSVIFDEECPEGGLADAGGNDDGDGQAEGGGGGGYEPGPGSEDEGGYDPNYVPDSGGDGGATSDEEDQNPDNGDGGGQDGENDGPPWDVDNDGEPNVSDDNIDNDDLPNGDDPNVDGDNLPNEEDPDIDGDGLPNGIDPDDDGDGILNAIDPTPQGPGSPFYPPLLPGNPVPGTPPAQPRPPLRPDASGSETPSVSPVRPVPRPEDDVSDPPAPVSPAPQRPVPARPTGPAPVIITPTRPTLGPGEELQPPAPDGVRPGGPRLRPADVTDESTDDIPVRPAPGDESGWEGSPDEFNPDRPGANVPADATEGESAESDSVLPCRDPGFITTIVNQLRKIFGAEELPLCGD